MTGFIKLEKRYGIEVWTAKVVDKDTKKVVDSSVFMSEQAARNWVNRHTLWN